MRGAVRFWFEARRRETEKADIEVFGGSTEGFGDEGEYGVYRECEASVRLFMLSATQWRTGPGGAVGLDYVAVSEVARGYGIELTREVWRGVAMMEDEALRLSWGEGE